jgi:transcriptional regulator with XRE-family HTH domain
MTKNDILDKLQQVVSKEPIKWHADSEFRSKNKKWLKRSQAVAFKVLRTLRENGVSQKDLAEKLNVSPQQVNKWLKGKENFTFETVSKLEDALNIELMSITGFETKYESNIKVIEVAYVRRQHYTPSKIRRKPVETKSIPFVSNKVPLKDFKKAM